MPAYRSIAIAFCLIPACTPSHDTPDAAPGPGVDSAVDAPSPAVDAPLALDASPSPACPAVTFHKVLATPLGGRVDWSHDGLHIATDRADANGCYDVYTMNPDGSDQTCVTCSNTQLPGPMRAKGNPGYDPSGRYIVMAAEAQTHSGAACSVAPGAGAYQEIWVLDQQTGNAYPLVSLVASSNPDVAIIGTLHPHISVDGKHLFWAEMYKASDGTPGSEFGYYRLMIGDLSIDSGGVMHLSNPTKLLPTAVSGTGFLESNSLSFDSTRIAFADNLGYSQDVLDRSDIWSANLDGSDLKQLTTAGYNEHVQLAPSGTHIAYMSSSFRTPVQISTAGTEFFLAHADGSDPCQLSHLNTPGFTESQAAAALASDSSWSPDGKHLAAYVQGPKSLETWILDFDTAQ